MPAAENSGHRSVFDDSLPQIFKEEKGTTEELPPDNPKPQKKPKGNRLYWGVLVVCSLLLIATVFYSRNYKLPQLNSNVSPSSSQGQTKTPTAVALNQQIQGRVVSVNENGQTFQLQTLESPARNYTVRVGVDTNINHIAPPIFVVSEVGADGKVATNVGPAPSGFDTSPKRIKLADLVKNESVIVESKEDPSKGAILNAVNVSAL